jgi:hypothetical protein
VIPTKIPVDLLYDLTKILIICMLENKNSIKKILKKHKNNKMKNLN